MSDMGKIINSHTVQFERVLPGPIDLVFDYLSKPECLSQWLMDAALEPRKGGRIQFKSGEIPESIEVPRKAEGHCFIRGIISEYAPPGLIAYSWNELNWDMASDVRFELQERGSEVFLTLTHSRIPGYLMPGVGAGWHTHLDSVVALIKGETPAEFLSSFNPRVAQYKAAIVAAGIIISAAPGATAQAASGDQAYEAVKTAKNSLIDKYDRLWKDADELKYKIDQLSKTPRADSERALNDLDKELKQTVEAIKKTEIDIRDLDKVLH